MTNAEKYAEQIASIIAESDHVCGHFVDLESMRCSYCPLHGRCNSKEAMKAFILQEAAS